MAQREGWTRVRSHRKQVGAAVGVPTGLTGASRSGAVGFAAAAENGALPVGMAAFGDDVGSELDRVRTKRPRESLAGVVGGGGAAVAGAVLKGAFAAVASGSFCSPTKVMNHIGCSCAVIVVPCLAVCSCTMADKIVSSSSAPRMRLRSFVYRLCSVRHVGDDEMESGEILLTNR